MKTDPIEECRVMAEHKIFIEKLSLKTISIKQKIKAYKATYLGDVPNPMKNYARGQKTVKSKTSFSSDDLKNKLRN